MTRRLIGLTLRSVATRAYNLRKDTARGAATDLADCDAVDGDNPAVSNFLQLAAHIRFDAPNLAMCDISWLRIRTDH